MDELRAAQQQTAANVTFLEAGEQELRQRMSSFPGTNWYSDFAILTYRTAAAKNVSPKLMRTTRVRSESLDANGRAPLLLLPPRP
jgi:hypothetical protein